MKIDQGIHKKASRFPRFIIAMMLGMLGFTSYFSVAPLYEAALERELDRAVDATRGVKKAIDERIYLTSNVVELARNDSRIFEAIRLAVQQDSFESLRALVAQYQVGARLAFLEIIGTDGKVLISSGLVNRFNQDVRTWDIYRENKPQKPAYGTTILNGKLYATSAISILADEGGELGTLVGAVELGDVFVEAISRELNSNLSIVISQESIASSFSKPDLPFIQKALAEGKTGIVQSSNERFALGKLQLTSVTGEKIGEIVVGSSIKVFDESVRGILQSNFLYLVLPFAVTATLTFLLGREIVRALAHLNKMRLRLETILLASRELSQTFANLQCAQVAARFLVENLPVSRECNVEFLFLNQSEVGTFLKHKIIERSTKVPMPFGESLVLPEDSELRRALESRGATSTPEGIVVPVVHGKKLLGGFVIHGYLAPELGAEDTHFLETMATTVGAILENIGHLKESEANAKAEAARAAELAAIAAVSEALIPEKVGFPGLSMSAHFCPAEQTGGDWFGYHYDERNHRLYFYIGDVTGHGIASALMTGVVCGAVKATDATADVLRLSREDSPRERLVLMANVANSVVLQTGRHVHLMTMYFFCLELETGMLTSLNAGHNHPIWLHSSGERKSTPIQMIGNRLGYTNLPEFHLKEVQLQPNDIIFAYTDGLIENLGPGGEALKERKLRALLADCKNPDEIKKRVIEEGETIWKEKPPSDDVTLFILQWHGPISREEIKRQMDEELTKSHTSRAA